jgi:hypothetical protein
MRRLGQCDGAPVGDVDDRGQDQPTRKGRREGQQTHRSKRSPSREHEGQSEREVPGSDLVRDVDRSALVGAVDQGGHRKHELSDGGGGEAEAQGRGERIGAMALGSGLLQDLGGQIGRVGEG